MESNNHIFYRKRRCKRIVKNLYQCIILIIGPSSVDTLGIIERFRDTFHALSYQSTHNWRCTTKRIFAGLTYTLYLIFIVALCHKISCCSLGVVRYHGDVIKWKHVPRYWPFVRGIHRLPVNSPHKGQWRGALMFSLIYAWINDWINNREAGDLRRHRYDVIVMCWAMMQYVLRYTMILTIQYVLRYTYSWFNPCDTKCSRVLLSSLFKKGQIIHKIMRIIILLNFWILKIV